MNLIGITSANGDSGHGEGMLQAGGSCGSVSITPLTCCVNRELKKIRSRERVMKSANDQWERTPQFLSTHPSVSRKSRTGSLLSTRVAGKKKEKHVSDDMTLT